jgi:cytochrome b
MSNTSQAPSETPRVKIWDPLVRITHWILVAAFAAAYITTYTGNHLIHHWAGYLIALTVIVRIVWGFVGPEKARFADFAYGPRRAMTYIGRLLKGTAPRYAGHSPVGGFMTVVFFILLLGTVWTGVDVLGAAHETGPLGGSAPGLYAALGLEAGTLHALFANLTLAFSVLHIVGVVYASHVTGQNLPRAMVDGRKRV